MTGKSVVPFPDWTDEERENPLLSRRIGWRTEQCWEGQRPAWDTSFAAGVLETIHPEDLARIVAYINILAGTTDRWVKEVTPSDFLGNTEWTAIARDEGHVSSRMRLFYRLYVVKHANDKRTEERKVSDRVWVWLAEARSVTGFPRPVGAEA